MKVQIGRPSCVISWIVSAALITSPLMAQSPPTTEVAGNASEDVANDSAPQVSNENREAVVDTSVLPKRPTPASVATVPLVNRNSIPTIPTRTAAYPSGSSKNSAPGETKWVILAALLAAGAVTAILLLRGGDGDTNHHPPGTQGTIIVAGTPSVSNRIPRFIDSYSCLHCRNGDCASVATGKSTARLCYAARADFHCR
jgi:hypothetical protein